MGVVTINVAVLASPTPTPPKSLSDPLDCPPGTASCCLETIGSSALPGFQCLGPLLGSQAAGRLLGRDPAQVSWEGCLPYLETQISDNICQRPEA